MSKSRTISMVAATACAGMLALALGGCVSSSATAAADNGITVSASSEVKVVPDTARITISIANENKEAQACQDENAKTVNAVIEALGKLEVDKTDIQTTYSNLSPSYGSRTSGDDDDEVYEDWVITGYEMNTALAVSGLEIDKVGAVIEACVAAGANGADGVEYYASNYDDVYNDALAQALEIAHGKAEQIAGASNVGVGKVVSVTEGYQDTSARYESADEALMDVASNAKSIAQTMPGQIGINANVTVTYAIS